MKTDLATFATIFDEGPFVDFDPEGNPLIEAEKQLYIGKRLHEVSRFDVNTLVLGAFDEMSAYEVARLLPLVIYRWLENPYEESLWHWCSHLSMHKDQPERLRLLQWGFSDMLTAQRQDALLLAISDLIFTYAYDDAMTAELALLSDYKDLIAGTNFDRKATEPRRRFLKRGLPD